MKLNVTTENDRLLARGSAFDCVMDLIHFCSPEERERVHAASAPRPALRIYSPVRGAAPRVVDAPVQPPFDWSARYEDEAVLQGRDGPDDAPLTVDGISADDVTDDDEDEDTTLYVEAEREAAALAFSLLGQDDAE